jgi:spore coat polysaccharide biosynthesis predicted glycosyltransferase SpsG
MGDEAPLRVLFGVAAGPRIGFGHLVRARSLARALGAPLVVVLRGTLVTRRRAAALGWQVIDAAQDDELCRFNPQLLVIDDPSIEAVRAWVRRARRLGLPAATVHDLGIAAVASDLVIDGTIAPRRSVRGTYGTLHGPAYAILDPAILTLRESRETVSSSLERGARPRAVSRRNAPPGRARSVGLGRVLIALGGGRHAALAVRLARAIAGRVGGVDIRIAGGFVAGRRPPSLGAGRWVDAKDGLAFELSAATLAIVAGGVTLHEACALGVPAIAVPMNPLQHITIRGIARRGAVVDGGPAVASVATGSGRSRGVSGFSRKEHADRIAREVQRLLGDKVARRRLAQAGHRLVDGRGVFRVAERLRRLAAHRDFAHAPGGGPTEVGDVG